MFDTPLQVNVFSYGINTNLAVIESFKKNNFRRFRLWTNRCRSDRLTMSDVFFKRTSMVIVSKIYKIKVHIPYTALLRNERHIVNLYRISVIEHHGPRCKGEMHDNLIRCIIETIMTKNKKQGRIMKYKQQRIIERKTNDEHNTDRV